LIYGLSDEDLVRKSVEARNASNCTTRFLLHSSKSSQIQEMIIFANKVTYFRIHKHPKGASESYHLIRGAIEVYFLDDSLRVKKQIELAEGELIFLRHEDEGYHLVHVLCDDTIFHETLSGPYIEGFSTNFLNVEFSSIDEALKALIVEAN
jgi:cupin fold WbuC family metalloprotein